MNKKIVFSVAASLTLLTAPFTSKADAAEPVQYKNVKVYQAQCNTNNTTDLNKWIQNWLKNNVKVQVNKQVVNPTIQKPEAQKPEAQKPVVQKPVVQKPVQNTQKPTTNVTKPAPAPTKPTGNQEQVKTGLNAYEQQVVDLTNKERAKYGLKALKVDSTLSKVAREKSKDMATNHYFSHNSPTYGSPFEMMKKFGISYKSAGENIAQGQRTPQEVVTAWMNSEGHRANILSKNFTHIGVGYVENGNYWTQQFIGK
ncbi:putative YkwD family protein [Oikeobacillus pervagus]|uniref:YkwD family protein n=1 Tax=Oikeobacillus pervagus TaxID=1325931 RepID=A0AAJ1SXJ6_9BACI|nr:CAP domain-containing protein [Oikeobacillus pervagus]MDQ0214409.1 putative YkwD family protein [Oikeobacillus pervagus]